MNNLKTHSYTLIRGDDMNVFFQRFLENKKYIIISLLCIYCVGFIFGCLQYNHTSKNIQELLQYLFYIKNENYQNHYQLYVIENGIYIFICTYLSTSYLGSLGIYFCCFLKGIQFAFSSIYINGLIEFHFLVFLLIIGEFIIEVMMMLAMNTIYIHISIYTAYVTFCVEHNFRAKSMFNYHLNGFILALMLFFIALCYRVYLVAMF